MKIEAARASETLVTHNQSSLRNIPQDMDLRTLIIGAGRMLQFDILSYVFYYVFSLLPLDTSQLK